MITPAAVKPAANRGLRMTEGPVGKLLTKQTVPLAWGILAVLGYRLAEAWFVGALGPGALAAISFAFPVTMVVLSLSIGLGAGTSSVIARALGAREEGVPRLVADALILTLLLGAGCAVIGFLPRIGWRGCWGQGRIWHLRSRRIYVCGFRQRS